MKTLCPQSYRYAVVQMDPVGMVKHFRDPIATAAAEGMRPQKYLVYLHTPLDLISPHQTSFRFLVSPIATTLRPEVKEKGITSDMVIPIYPNTHHPGGPRRPINTHPVFPFPNCYHWYKNDMIIRIRRKSRRYDDSRAVRVDIWQHMQISKGFRDDGNRLHQFWLDQQAAAELASSNEKLPCAKDGRAASSSQLSVSTDEGVIDDVDSLPEGPDDSDADSRKSLHVTSPDSRRDTGDPTAAVIRIDPFGFRDVHPDEFMPLVHLWFELTEHLTSETIPNPIDFFKERDAITRIIHDAMERASDGVELPSDDSGIDTDSEVASVISTRTSGRNDFLYNELSLLPEEVRKRVGMRLLPPAKQPPPMKPLGRWQRVKNRARCLLWHPLLWQAHPPLLPCWP